MSVPTTDKAAYLRNFVFGVEDSLVSTVGLLSGVAITGMAREDIFVTGLILIFVEAISMSAGSFLSESSAEEYETRRAAPTARSYFSSGIMFVSYFISGFIPLAPYLFLEGAAAFFLSIGVSLAALVILGALSARFSRVRAIPSIVRMTLIGGLAIGAGLLVGGIASSGA